MLKDLIKIADKLDSLGFLGEANSVDYLIRKLSNIDNSDDDDDDDDEESILNEMLSNKNNYKNVFKTSNGLTYFVKHDGSTIRYKEKAYPGLRRFQPVMEKIFFISQDDADNILKNYRLYHGTYIEPICFQQRECNIGLVPLELNRLKWFNSCEINNLDDQNVCIKLTGPFHIGHEIVEIIK